MKATVCGLMGVKLGDDQSQTRSMYVLFRNQRNKLGVSDEQILSLTDFNETGKSNVREPDLDLEEIAPRVVPPPHAAFKGDVSRVILDTLRQTTRPLSTRDVTYAL